MHKRRGWLVYHAESGRYAVDWRRSLSIAVGELLLEEILAAQPHLRGRLLDLGCGKRPYSLIYDPLVAKSVGTEVTFSPHGTADADVLARGEALPFRDDAFDTILCTEVLEHTVDPFEAMREISRLLAPGGYLLLSVPFLYPVHEAPHDYWRLTFHGLAALVRSVGLVPLYVRPKGGPIATLVSLAVNVAVRAANAVTKGLRLSKPLVDRPAVRLLLALPQWVYVVVRKRAMRHKHPLWVRALELWMTPGYVILATKVRTPSQTTDTRVLRGTAASRADVR